MSNSTWKAGLVWYERVKGRAVSDQLETEHGQDALAHFRRLLAHDELAGYPVAARLKSAITGKFIYFSDFAKAFGEGRIHPEAPLDLYRRDDGTAEATPWKPKESR